MKHSIEHLLPYRLRNEEYFGFHSEILELVNQCQFSETYQALVAIYNNRYAELHDAMDVAQSSDFTRQLIIADKQRILTYRRIRASIRGFLHHIDSAKSDAAHRTILFFDHYGNLPRTSRDERSYRIVNLIADLRERTAADLQFLGINAWLDELNADNQAYLNLKESRSKERENRAPAMKMNQAREVVDFAYESLVCHLKVYGVLNPADENFLSLAFNINYTIDRFNHLGTQRYGIMAARKTKVAELAV